jgi:hypothetical protein
MSLATEMKTLMGQLSASASAAGMSESEYYLHEMIKEASGVPSSALAALAVYASANNLTLATAQLSSQRAASAGLSAGGTIAGTLICQKDNASSFRLRGPQASSEGGAMVQSYAGMFYNDGYIGTGTKKTRAIFGANLEMDLEFQSPHQLRLIAVDGTQTDGKLYAASQTDMVFNLRADAEVASPKQLVFDRLDTGSVGAANTSAVNVKASSGNLHLQGGTLAGVVFPSMSTTDRDLMTLVAGLVIFNTTDSKLQVYTGTVWADLH